MRVAPRSGFLRSGMRRDCDSLVPLPSGSSEWPTPTARDHMPAHSPEYIREKRAQGHGMANLNDVVRWRHLGLWPRYPPFGEMGVEGGINPSWAEWLMGLPDGWTEVEHDAP